MEVYKNVDLDLAYTVTTETTSETIPEDLGYPNFEVGAKYYRGDVVHSAVSDGGDGRNYKLIGPYLRTKGKLFSTLSTAAITPPR